MRPAREAMATCTVVLNWPRFVSSARMPAVEVERPPSTRARSAEYFSTIPSTFVAYFSARAVFSSLAFCQPFTAQVSARMSRTQKTPRTPWPTSFSATSGVMAG
ncbi:MAG: hypothetical protein WKG00_03370 [Polyangiaceae bacterium]